MGAEKERMSNYHASVVGNLRASADAWCTKSRELDDIRKHASEVENQLVSARRELIEVKQLQQTMSMDIRDRELKYEKEVKTNAQVKAKVADLEATVEDLSRRLKKAAEEYVELKKSKYKSEAKYDKLKSKLDVSSILTIINLLLIDVLINRSI